MKDFENQLSGGHPNSLGNTEAVVEQVLSNNDLFLELFNCYCSEDEIVRLRVSSAMKRICKAKKELLIPYLDRFLGEISQIDQPSTKWTLAQLFLWLQSDMTESQLRQAQAIVKHNLETEPDWIVLNTSMESLHAWAKSDEELKNWLVPRLRELEKDTRKSVANRAKKYLKSY